MANQVRISQQLLGKINSLTDQSTVDHWTEVLQAFGQTLQHHGDVLRIIKHPVCYSSLQQRTTIFDQSRLSQEARDLDTAYTFTRQAFGNDFRSYGSAGLIASPTGSITFEGTPTAFSDFVQAATARQLAKGSPEYNALQEQHRQQWFNGGGYYGNWHCIAFFIRARTLFLYDPDFNASELTADAQGRIRLRQIRGIARVQPCLIENERFTVDRYFILDRPGDGLAPGCHFNFAGSPGRQCVARSLAWLWKIVEDTANDYGDSYQGGGGVSGSASHGCVPGMPYLTTPEAVDLATLEASGWRQLHR